MKSTVNRSLQCFQWMIAALDKETVPDDVGGWRILTGIVLPVDATQQRYTYTRLKLYI